jgi:hypothetical protein
MSDTPHDIPQERFTAGFVAWPDPAPEPVGADSQPVEVLDHHLGPLDRDEDRRWLHVGDPRLRQQDDR